MKKRELYKIEGEKITRLRRNCPKCGDGIFLAEHKNRLSCGTCGYTEFKGKQTKPTEQTAPVPSQESKPEESPQPTEEPTAQDTSS